MITSVKTEDDGIYTCTATNQAGKVCRLKNKLIFL